MFTLHFAEPGLLQKLRKTAAIGSKIILEKIDQMFLLKAHTHTSVLSYVYFHNFWRRLSSEKCIGKWYMRKLDLSVPDLSTHQSLLENTSFRALYTQFSFVNIFYLLAGCNGHSLHRRAKTQEMVSYMILHCNTQRF